MSLSKFESSIITDDRWAYLANNLLGLCFQFLPETLVHIARMSRVNKHWRKNARSFSSMDRKLHAKVEFWNLSDDLNFNIRYYLDSILPRMPAHHQSYDVQLRQRNEVVWHNERVATYPPPICYQVGRFQQVAKIVNSCPQLPGLRIISYKCVHCCKNKRFESGRYHTMRVATTTSNEMIIPQPAPISQKINELTQTQLPTMTRDQYLMQIQQECAKRAEYHLQAAARSSPVLSDINAFNARELVIVEQVKLNKCYLPNILTHLKSLRSLSLEHCCLSNEDIKLIAENSTHISSLTILSPTVHPSTEEFPSDDCPKISDLAIESISKMTKLHELRIPHQLLTCRALKWLSKGDKSIFGQLTALQIDHWRPLVQPMNIQYNEIHNSMTDEMNEKNTLAEYASSNIGDIINVLCESNNQTLKIFALSDIIFDSKHLENIGKLRSLTSFQLHGKNCGLNDEGLTFLTELPITTINLSECLHITYKGMRNLPKTLTEVNLQLSRHIGDLAIQALVTHLNTSLLSLQIDQCPITNLAVKCLALAPNLHSLCLSGINEKRLVDENFDLLTAPIHPNPLITDDCFIAIARIPCLTALQLRSMDDIGGKALAWHMRKEKAPKLIKLRIDNCKCITTEECVMLNQITILVYNGKSVKLQPKIENLACATSCSSIEEKIDDKITKLNKCSAEIHDDKPTYQPMYTCFECDLSVAHNNPICAYCLPMHGEHRTSKEPVMMVGNCQCFQECCDERQIQLQIKQQLELQAESRTQQLQLQAELQAELQVQQNLII